MYTRTVSYTTSCGKWSRCTRYRAAYYTKYREETRRSYKTEYGCCTGWRQVRNECPNAICRQSCVHGNCTRPNVCSCYSGYYGNRCDIDCPPDKWGAHCKYDCLCTNNATCSPHTGNCSCTPGWEGKYCNKPCDQGYYGDKCQSVCQCQNGAVCDVISGNCTCAPGYHGERCEMPCYSGSYGQNCTFQCACQENTVCDHVNGTCYCSSGWTGDICNQTCPHGTYGDRCAQQCLNCMNGATCDHVTGICVCKPGYIGDRCQDTCQGGTYGLKCLKKCGCQNNAICSPINGFCNCTSGFTGVHCDETQSVDTTRQTKDEQLLFIIISAGTVFFVIVTATAVGCFIRHKRSKRKPERDETADNPQSTESNEEQHYQSLSSIPITTLHSDAIHSKCYVDNNVHDTSTVVRPQSTATFDDYYMALHNSGNKTIYEVSPVCNRVEK